MNKNLKVIISAGVGGLLLVIVLLFSIHHVPVGMIGIETNMCRVTGKVYDSGWYFTVPFATKIHKLSIRNQKLELPETQGELSGQELVYMKIAMTYSLDREKASDVYVNYGSDYIDTLMPQTETFDIIKGTVAKYSIDEFAQKRDEIFAEAKNNLNNKMKERGITVNTLALADYRFTDEMEAAIAQKNKATQDRKTQEEENQKNLQKAEADAKVKKTTAEGEAEAIRIKADAEAYSNQKINDSLTDNIVKMKAIEAFKEKWDGKYPSVVTGDSDMFFNLGDYLNK